MGAPSREKDLCSYNPVTHTGSPGADAEAGSRRPNNKYSTATAARSNLYGSACMPKQDAPASDSKASTRPTSTLQLPARVDHLNGTACLPSSSRDLSSSSSSGADNLHTASKAKLLTLRAVVDHLAGEGCTVRQVDVVATLDAPPPRLNRGMATRLVRDRQVARAAHEHNMSSCLYQPGQGYTKVLLAGQGKAQRED